MALLLSMWAIALAQETTTTTTTGTGDSTTTTASGGSTTTSEGGGTTSSTESTATTAIEIVTVTSLPEDAVPTFVATAGGRLAWTGISPGGYSTMYVFSLSTSINIQIPAATPGPYYNPSADGPWVVYQGGRAGGYDDIWAYDTGSGATKRITNNSDPGDGNDWNPRIDNGRIVWEKRAANSNSETGIYLYDLNAPSTKPLTLLLAGADYRSPDIWGDYVVCVKDAATGNGSEIILYNLKTDTVQIIASGAKNNEHPRIDSGHVVWSSGDIPEANWYAWSTYQIKLYDISTGVTTDLTDNAAGNSSPSISGDIIAWEQRDPSSIIYYDSAVEQRITLTVQGDTLKSPDVGDGIIAFFGNKALYYHSLESETIPFPDVPRDSPYLTAISEMAMNRIIEGYEDGRFGLNNPITRQQFAKMIVLTMAEWKPAVFTPSLTDTYSFADSEAIEKVEGELYPYHYVAKAALTGLTRGFYDGTFRPLDNITCQQVISMIVRAGRQVLETPTDFVAGRTRLFQQGPRREHPHSGVQRPA